MELLTYTTNNVSPLNEARRQLWSSKYMLGMANKHPGQYAGKGFWMGQINRDRAALRKVAHELRAKLPARKLYRVTMQGEVLHFSVCMRAHKEGQAWDMAQSQHKSFSVSSVMEIPNV